MTLVCISGVIDHITFLIFRDDTEGKYIANIFEGKHTESDDFERFEQAESWVKEYINDYTNTYYETD